MDVSQTGLKVDGLVKTYPGATGGARDVSFDLAGGTFFTLLGPSGCGKTTTLRCIAGLEQPDGGAIRLGGDAFFDAARGTNVPLNLRNVGMVFQSYAIWPHLTVFENVAFPLRVGKEKFTTAQVREMVGQALASVDLSGYESRSATQLSGGQQQRVALARAIVKKPRLLLLDEPLSNLDALLRDEMRRELKRLQRRLGVTTVYVTHDQAEALEMSDVVAVMNHGKIVQMGSPQDIYFRPANAFVANFMGSTNVLPATVVISAPADGRTTVKLANGAEVACRFGRPTKGGEAVAVSIRPEEVTVSLRGSAAGAGGNRLDGTVVSAGFLGHATRYEIDVNGLMLQASIGSRTIYEAGTPVTVDFAADTAVGLALDDDHQSTDFSRNRQDRAA